MGAFGISPSVSIRKISYCFICRLIILNTEGSQMFISVAIKSRVGQVEVFFLFQNNLISNNIAKRFQHRHLFYPVHHCWFRTHIRLPKLHLLTIPHNISGNDVPPWNVCHLSSTCLNPLRFLTFSTCYSMSPYMIILLEMTLTLD